MKSIINARDDIFEKAGFYSNIDEFISTVGADEVAKIISENNWCEKLKDSMTNLTYKIKWHGEDYVLRIPGAGTSDFIDRKKEEFFNRIAVSKKICPYTEFYNCGKIKLVKFLEDIHTFDYNRDSINDVISLLNKFYENQDFSIAKTYERSLVDEVKKYEKLYNYKTIKLPENYNDTKSKILNYLYDHNGKPKFKLEISHGDIIAYNILVENDKPNFSLIDFEYAGFLSRYWDYGALVSEIELQKGIDRREIINCAAKSDKRLDKDLILIWSYIVDYIWACWGWAKTSAGENYAEYAIERYNKSLNLM